MCPFVYNSEVENEEKLFIPGEMDTCKGTRLRLFY